MFLMSISERGQKGDICNILIEKVVNSCKSTTNMRQINLLHAYNSFVQRIYLDNCVVDSKEDSTMRVNSWRVNINSRPDDVSKSNSPLEQIRNQIRNAID